MKPIYVFGSINIDLVISCDKAPEAGETVAGKNYFQNFGGKGANQAIAAAKLGADVTFIGAVGDDAHGEEALENLKTQGVKVPYVKKVKTAPTGVAIITRTGFENRIIVYPGANACVEKCWLDNIADLDTGYFIAQLETPYDETMKVLKEVRSKGLYTILNPAPARKIETDDYKGIDLLVVNQSECALLSGIYPNGIQEVTTAFEWFKTLGVTALIVTLGEKGSVYMDASQCIEVQGIQVDAVDTTAAGDSYIGAFTYALSIGKSLNEALNFATKVSAITVTREGAANAIPTLSEVATFFKEK